DVIPAQSYFYQHDIFPLAKCRFDASSSSCRREMQDSVWSTDYRLPEFKIVHLDIRVDTKARLPSLSDKLASATLRAGAETITIDSQPEERILLELDRT